MFVNVILAKYEEMSELDSLPITSHDLNNFRKLWTQLDPSATRWITETQVRRRRVALVLLEHSSSGHTPAADY
eukprot:COSAG06_NODE_1223_length_10199_cov_3.394356_4_plen_73_part_00